MEIDQLRVEDGKDCSFGTTGIESQLQKLDIQVLGPGRAKLPVGWTLAPQAMHRGSPTIILNADGVEMARWDGGRDKARFFVCVEPGVYSAEDLAYMALHVHCGHADCHQVKTKEYVAGVKKANKRRESVAKSRAKANGAKRKLEPEQKVAEKRKSTPSPFSNKSMKKEDDFDFYTNVMWDMDDHAWRFLNEHPSSYFGADPELQAAFAALQTCNTAFRTLLDKRVRTLGGDPEEYLSGLSRIE